MGVESFPQYALWILVDFRTRRMHSHWERECRGKGRQQQGRRSEGGARVLSKPPVPGLGRDSGCVGVGVEG